MTETGNPVIGVFDSGLGGLTVVRELRRQIPSSSIIYLGDTARVPYGTKSESTIRRFAVEDTEFLLRRGVDLLVIACHTVSSVASDYLKALHPELKILSVLEPSVEAAVSVTKDRKIGIIGTTATVRSGKHRSEILKHGDFDVVEKPCPLFVPLVEEGLIDGTIPELVAKMYLEGLKGRIDTLVLACTHYPLLKPIIRRVMGENVALVDPSEEVAKKVAQLLPTPGDKKGQLQVYLTDIPPGYLGLIERFLGEPPDSIIKVSVFE